MRRHLTLAPEIRAQRPTGDGPLGRVVDQDGQRGAANVDARLRVKVAQGPRHASGMDATALGGQACVGFPFGRHDPHVIQYRTNCEARKGQSHRTGEIADFAINADNLRMARPRKSREGDPWKQRDRFIQLADDDVAELVAQGMTEDEAREVVALAIGLKTGASLKTAYRHDHRRSPKRKTIELAAKRWHVDESEIYGTTANKQMSPAKRLVRQSVTKLLEDPNISDEDAERVWDAIQKRIEAGEIPAPR